MSSFKEYNVRVYENGDKQWFLNDKLHREDGPAIELANGYKAWYLNGEELAEDKWKARVRKLIDSCDGKVVEIDGKKYRLMGV